MNTDKDKITIEYADTVHNIRLHSDKEQGFCLTHYCAVNKWQGCASCPCDTKEWIELWNKQINNLR
jgi:hypothetical protein